jgi:hypothetical protein
MCKDRTFMCTAQGRGVDARKGPAAHAKYILDITHYVQYSMFHTV